MNPLEEMSDNELRELIEQAQELLEKRYYERTKNN